MNENIEIKEIEIIKDAFKEKREIIGFAPKEMTEVSDECHHGGDIFITDTDELIDLEFQMVDFDENELAKYIELAEELYEKNKVHISIYILCPKTIKVTVPECTIKSEANFTIKLACFQQNPIYDVLYHIKEKVDKKIRLNDEDLHTLSMIPVMGSKEERKNLRIECFRLLKKANQIN